MAENVYPMNTNVTIDGRVEGKVALVTGSTRVIGLGIARHLAAKGCDVIITGLGTPGEIDAILTEFRSSYGGKFTYVSGDLSDQNTTLEMCEAVICEYANGIDILINNAGLMYFATLEEYPLSKFNEMMAINLTPPFIITKFFIPFMKQKGWGRIVNTASQRGLISAPTKVVYSATKAGLIGLTKGTALEVAPHDITCNAICPGFVETPEVIDQINAMCKGQSISVVEAREKFFTDKGNPTQKPVTI